MSYAASKQKYVEAHPEVAQGVGEPMPCMVCGAITPHKTLSTLGARCARCFKAYCEAPQPPAKRWTGRTPGQQGHFDVPEAP